MDDVVGEPTDDELGDLEEEPVVDESTGEQVVDTPAGGDAGDEPAGGGDEDVIEPPKQDADGKWTSGKYKADTLEDLFVQVEKGRRHAERALSKKADTGTPDPTVNPFLPKDEDEEDEGDEPVEVIDEADFAKVLGTTLAEQLVAAGLAPQPQVDPQYAAQQALVYADQAVQNPATTGADFEAVLYMLMQHAPYDEQRRNAVLEAWAELGGANVLKAATAKLEIDQAFRDIAAAQATMQHQQQYEAEQAQQQAAEQQVEQQTTAVQDAFAAANKAWTDANPDWQAYDAGMNEWMQANPGMLARAKGDAAAIFDVFTAAKQYAVQKAQLAAGLTPAAPGGAAVAGMQPGVAESAGTMGAVNPNQYVDPAALERAQRAQQRDAAGLENGVTDDVEVTVLGSTPASIADSAMDELIGIPTVQ